MQSEDGQLNKGAEARFEFCDFPRNCGLLVSFDMRNCYKLALLLTLKTVRKKCESFVRSMNGACLRGLRRRRRLGYRLLLIEIFLDGLMK